MIRERAPKVLNLPKHVIEVNKVVGRLRRHPPLGCPSFALKCAKPGGELEDIFKSAQHGRRGRISRHSRQLLVDFTLKFNDFLRGTVELCNMRKQEYP